MKDKSGDRYLYYSPLEIKNRLYDAEKKVSQLEHKVMIMKSLLEGIVVTVNNNLEELDD